MESYPHISMANDAFGLIKSKAPESLIIENLKTLRVLHQLLMVVAAAILAFALRADLSKQYRGALDELAALKETPFEKWVTFISDRYKDDREHNDNFARSIVRQAGLP
jgi:hypothetical protein